MLFAIIEDKNNNTWSQLFLNKNGTNISFSGFSVTNGVLSKFKREYLSVFETFILSDENEAVGKIDGYDAVFDLKNNFYHFFKEGKEDFEKFLIYNSKDANVYEGSGVFKSNSMMRKFYLSAIGVFLIIDISLVGLVINKYSNQKNQSSYDISSNVQVIEDDIFGTISDSFEEIEDILKQTLEVSQIRELIYDSENLNVIEKDFLWNPELINMVVPYYINTNFEAVTLARHTNLKIESYTSDDNINGYYSGDNVLHLKDYDVKNIEEENDQCRDAGHEYIHSLQVSSCPIFIREASAEIMSHEFFLNSSDMSLPYTYYEACKCLKILMEVIGPEVIIDSNFNLNSTALSDAVKDYFSDEEYEEFFDILNLSPHYDSEELEQGKYNRFYELLNILYTNKYGDDIENDVMINAIKNGGSYNRPYFRKSLVLNSSSYYVINEVLSFEEVDIDKIVNIKKEECISKNEFFDKSFRSDCAKYIIPKSKSDSVIDINVSVSYSEVEGSVTLSDGTVLSVLKAENLGYIEIEYRISKEISIEEYLKNYDDGSLYKFQVIHYVSSITDKFLDKESQIKLS